MVRYEENIIQELIIMFAEEYSEYMYGEIKYESIISEKINYRYMFDVLLLREPTEEIFKKLLERIINCDINFQYNFIQQYLDQLEEFYNEVGHLFYTLDEYNTLKLYHSQFKLCIMKRLAKERTEKFKEELVMKTWHPFRVQKWLEAGMDIEDM